MKLIPSILAQFNPLGAAQVHTVLIRSDFLFATKGIISFLNDHADFDTTPVVKAAYKNWSEAVLNGLKTCLDYKKLGYTQDRPAFTAMCYDGNASVAATIAQADELSPSQKPFIIAQDELISEHLIRTNHSKAGHFAFSRLFDTEGKNYQSIVERPGYPKMEIQAKQLTEMVKNLRANANKVPVVFLEDNIRHAKMVLWGFSILKDAGFFEHAEPIGISSTFSCATPEELEKIQLNGKNVPVHASIQSISQPYDIITLRDLLFDGFVVNDESGQHSRKPGLWMDVTSRFNVAASKETAFKSIVLDASLEFINTVEKATNINLPISCFPLTHLNTSEKTPVKNVLHSLRVPTPNNVLPLRR